MRAGVVLFFLLAGCSGPAPLVCGEGADPVIVTGLNGVLDGHTPAVEVQLRVPESCEVLDTDWTFWDEATGTARLGEEPIEGVLERGGVEVDDTTIFFRAMALGLRLEYPGGDAGPALALVWFGGGADLATVDCASSGETLACAVRP